MTDFTASDLYGLAQDLGLSPAQSLYLGAAMRTVASAGGLTGAQALQQVRVNGPLADYLRDRLRYCVEQHGDHGFQKETTDEPQ